MRERAIPQDKKGQEHLANERTFLAWIRTAIAIVSLGFVVAKVSLWLQAFSETAGRQAPRAHGVSLPMGEGLMIFGGLPRSSPPGTTSS